MAKYFEDVNKAETDYNTAIGNAKNAMQNAYDNARVLVVSAEKAQARAEKELALANDQLSNDPDNKDLQSAVKTAEEAVKTAKAAVEKANTDASTMRKTASATYRGTINKAETDKLKAQNAAEEAAINAYKEFVANGQYEIDKDPAYAPVKAANEKLTASITAAGEANDKVNDAIAALNEKFQAISEAVSEQETAIDYSWNLYNLDIAEGEVSDYLNGDIESLPVVTAPVEDIYNGIYYNAKNYLIAKSNAAYGDILVKFDSENDVYDFRDKAFLVDEVTKDMADEYIADWAKRNGYNIKPYQYYTYYHFMFGTFGQTLYYENRIAVAKAYLANTDLINEVTKTLKENLDALNKGYADAEAAVEKIVEEKNAVDEEIEDLTKALYKKHADLVSLATTLDNIIRTIEWGLAKVEFPEKRGEALPAILKSLNEETEKYEGYLANWNKELEKAQYQLDQYNNGYTDIENPLKIKVDYYKTLLDQAQAQVDFDKARLDELQAKYEAATKKQ